MNQDSVNIEAVLRRVQKLLAIAQDHRADPNEAAAAAAQAEKVMRKYQIEHADAMRTAVAQSDSIDTADCSVIMKRDLTGKSAHRPSKVPGWGGWLAYSVAKLNNCEIRYGYDVAVGAVVRFFGFKADVQVAAWTFDYLVTQTIAGVRQYQKVAKASGFARTKQESESFRRGFVLAVCRMIDAEAKSKREELATLSTSCALVVIKEQAIAERFGAFTYHDSKSNANLNGNAYHDGLEAGRKVQLRSGVSSNGAAALQLD